MQAFQEFLKRHHLPSIHAAHRRTKIGREALTKMADGDPPGLEIVERLARWGDEDVNQWRTLYGYEPVKTPNDLLNEGLLRIEEETGVLPVVSCEDIRAAQSGREAVEQVLAAARARALSE